MTDQIPTPPSQPAAPPPPTGDWRAQRQAERMSRHEARWQARGRHTGWIWGVILILLGVVLLLQQMGYPELQNWWALFILIPAISCFYSAWDTYQENHRLTRRAASTFTIGVLLTILTAILLFNLALGILWPVLLIA